MNHQDQPGNLVMQKVLQGRRKDICRKAPKFVIAKNNDMVWFPTEIDDPWFPPRLQRIDNIIFADQDTQVPILSCYIYNIIYNIIYNTI